MYVWLFHHSILFQQIKCCFCAHGVHKSTTGSISASLKAIKDRVPDIKELPVHLEGQEKMKSQTKWYSCHCVSTNLILFSKNSKTNDWFILGQKPCRLNKTKQQQQNRSFLFARSTSVNLSWGATFLFHREVHYLSNAIL